MPSSNRVTYIITIWGRLFADKSSPCERCSENSISRWTFPHPTPKVLWIEKTAEGRAVFRWTQALLDRTFWVCGSCFVSSLQYIYQLEIISVLWQNDNASRKKTSKMAQWCSWGSACESLSKVRGMLSRYLSGMMLIFMLLLLNIIK